MGYRLGDHGGEDMDRPNFTYAKPSIRWEDLSEHMQNNLQAKCPPEGCPENFPGFEAADDIWSLGNGVYIMRWGTTEKVTHEMICHISGANFATGCSLEDYHWAALNSAIMAYKEQVGNLTQLRDWMPYGDCFVALEGGVPVSQIPDDLKTLAKLTKLTMYSQMIFHHLVHHTDDHPTDEIIRDIKQLGVLADQTHKILAPDSIDAILERLLGGQHD